MKAKNVKKVKAEDVKKSFLCVENYQLLEQMNAFLFDLRYRIEKMRLEGKEIDVENRRDVQDLLVDLHNKSSAIICKLGPWPRYTSK